MRRIVSFFLCFVLIITGLPFAQAASFPLPNDSSRHEICTALSDQAEAYYQGDFAFPILASLEGTSTGSSLAGTQTALYAALQELMQTTLTQQVSYSALTAYWPYTDTQPGFSHATLFYSDSDSGSFNREHVWPKSRGSFYQIRAGADLHHLRPTDTDVNSTRGNMTMGNVREKCSTYSTKTYGGKTVLYYNTGADLVEVNDNIKGDVARILLYVYVSWGQPNLFENVPASDLPPRDRDDSDNNGLRVMDDLSTLLQWCQADPVDQWEMTRNDRVQDVQGNRNVFIDYPELAWLLFDQELPSDMPTPSGYAQSGSPTVYTVTALSNNTQWGTVAVQGSKVLCFPANGYCTEGCTISPENAAEVTRVGDSFILRNLQADVTVSVSFAPKSPASVSYLVPAGVSVADPEPDCFVGDSITLPGITGSPALSDHAYTFRGWVTTAVEPTQDPSDLEILVPGSSFTLAAQNTFYALFSYTQEGSGSSNTFTLLTQAPADWSGEYVLTGTKGDDLYLLLTDGSGINSASSAHAIGSTTVEKDGNTLLNVPECYVLAAESVGNGQYALRLKGAESEAYLTCPENKNILGIDGSADSEYAHWTLSLSSSGVDITNVGFPGRILRFNDSAYMFRCYSSGQKAVSLYRAGASVAVTFLTLADASHEHVYASEVTTEPTCTEEGVMTFTCACGDSYTEVIPALGHEWDEGTVTVEPTYSAPGELTYTCARCGETRTEQIEKLVLPFIDVPEDSFFFDPVAWALDNGITTGATEDTFNPTGECMRAQVVTFLWRAAGCPEPTTAENPFEDVKETDFFYKAVLWAVENKITSGMDATHFGPFASCNRAQVVTFLWRMAGCPMVEAENPFEDVPEESFYTAAVLWAVENGITNGMDETHFGPGIVCNRAQVVTFLYRAFVS